MLTVGDTPLMSVTIAVIRGSGCIGLRDLAKSLRRGFLQISDYSGWKVQRKGCVNNSYEQQEVLQEANSLADGWRRSRTSR